MKFDSVTRLKEGKVSSGYGGGKSLSYAGTGAGNFNPTEQDVEIPQLDWEFKEKILDLFENQAVYRTRGLSSSELAKMLGISPRLLSSCFKVYFKSSFRTFVNEYRVELAKRKIEEGYLDSFTIESLGAYCGFSSRTTFFNVFKKRYKDSPAGFWKTYQGN